MGKPANLYSTKCRIFGPRPSGGTVVGHHPSAASHGLPEPKSGNPAPGQPPDDGIDFSYNNIPYLDNEMNIIYYNLF